MGSGLILLVIVGAWLAVLVPMGLRSHDSAAAARSTERFSEAMRVLSRRSAVVPEAESSDRSARRSLSVLLRHARAAWAGTRLLRRAVRGVRSLHVRRTGSRAVRRAPSRAVRPGTSRAVRRGRVLLALLLVSAASLVVGLVGPAVLLGLSGAVAGLAVLFVVQCRRQAARAARRRARVQVAAGLRRRELAADTASVVPPARLAPVGAPEPVVASVPEPVPAEVVSAVSVDVPLPARVPAAVGAEWLPVPVPLPTYVGKAVAPRPTPAVEPDGWRTDLYADDESGAESGAGLDRRRAVGGW